MNFKSDTETLLQACTADLEQGRFRVVADTWNGLSVVGRHSRFMKFPKNQDARNKLALEADICHCIDTVQPGLAPHYAYCGPLGWGEFDYVAIREFNPGITANTLSNSSDRIIQLLFDVGIAAAMVHKLVTPALQGQVPDRHSLDWYSGLRDNMRDAADSHRLRQWSEALDTIRVASPSTLTLIHGDLKPAHLLRLADGRVRFLDWSNVRKEQPAFDCATMMASCDNKTYDAFKAGYQSVAPYPENMLIDAYAQIIDLEAAWFEHHSDRQ